jgi:hypothetical protein
MSEEVQEVTPTVPEEAVQSTSPNNEPSQEKPEDINWRAFREARKKDRMEKEAAEKRAMEKEAEAAALRAAMEAAFAKQQPPVQQGYFGDNSYELTEEQRIEQLVQKAIEQREQANERQRQERERQEMPIRLRTTHSDFDQVVNEENLDYLEYHYPEIAGPLKRLPDSYDKWGDIYKAVKRFVPNSANSSREAAKAKANQTLPKSISSTQITNTEHSAPSQRLTEQRRAENWQRMQRQLKGLG